jgi:hypothetical protein
VMLEQTHNPALQGGGDVVVSGVFGSVPSARFIMSSVIGAPDLTGQIAAVSPSKDGRLFLLAARGPLSVSARGGIPSLERAIGDPEVSSVTSWIDRAGDERWAHPEPGSILRAMDRFHRIPKTPAYRSSWAEWLYFNGRTPDGRMRLYLTFLVGPPAATRGKRTAGVRLQLERDGRSSNYAAHGEVDDAALADAPNLEIAGNRVQLTDLRYHITLALHDEKGSEELSGAIDLDAAPGRSLPPVTIRGANGWLTGYVAPVLAGRLSGALRAGRDTVQLDRASGYHDHNWGFWEGVSWQWGQVAHDDVSIVYGRVFPPADVADAARMPGFLAVLGREGPLAFSTDVKIDDHDPGQVDVRARGPGVDLRLTMSVEDTTRSERTVTRAPGGGPVNFLQLGGPYHVTGKVADRDVDFTARGAAETFRP